VIRTIRAYLRLRRRQRILDARGREAESLAVRIAIARKDDPRPEIVRRASAEAFRHQWRGWEPYAYRVVRGGRVTRLPSGHVQVVGGVEVRSKRLDPHGHWRSAPWPEDDSPSGWVVLSPAYTKAVDVH
jgi:hypothetical protein